MKLLVTGGAGFIGCNFIYYILAKYPADSLTCVDALTYAGNLASLERAREHANFRFYKADVANRAAIFDIFEAERPDAVIHFAAESHVDRSLMDPGIFVRTNVLGTQVLLDACRSFGNIRFHQVGTDEVYGDLPLDRPDLKFTESTPLSPSSPYSASKAAADLLALAYARTFALPATVSRCSNNYGPYQFPEKLIPVMITRALADETLPIYGKGQNVRDWLYVEDHCAALDAILRRGSIGKLYNIGGNAERSNLKVVQTLLRTLGKPENLIQYVTDRPGHDLRYAIDATKMRRELDWEPRVDFDTGLRRTVEWYLANADWWREILSGEYKSYYVRNYDAR
ncbi:MAG: dTDP-glucose 4,6-dehydratase [Clostridiales bacterium]|nr:dTDP-glucose 4,6-dehydratase [Clostridiales bacterium]